MVLAKQTYKLGKQGMLDKEIQETIDRNEEELEQVKQDAADAVQKADDLTQQVTDANAQIGQVDIKLETEVGKINTDIHDLNNRLKAPNLIAEPEPFPIMADYPATQNSIDVGGWARMDSRVNNKEITPKILRWFNAEKGTKYTQQIEIRTNGELNSLVFSFYTQSNFTHNEVNATIKQIGQGHYIVYASWEATQNGDTRVLDIKRLNFTGTYIEFRHPKLEKGDYTPYYLDGQTTVNTLKRLQETQDGFVSEISSMKIYQKPNLIGNKDPMIQLRCFPNNNQSSNDNGWAKFNNTCSGQEILPVSDISLAVQANKKYTQQVEINTDGTLKGLEFTFFAGGHNVKKANIISLNEPNSYVAYASWTPSANNNLRCIDIRSITIEGGSYVKFRHPKIEEGDYTPYSLSDAMGNLATQISKVEHTAAGLQETVADSVGKITQNTQTIEGFNSKVQTIEGKLTEHTQTIDGFEATVSNLDGRVTTNTQNIEGFNRRVETIDGKVSENTQTINGMRDFIGEMQGGRPNLLQDPTNLANTTYWEPKGNGIEVKGETVKITGAWAGIGYKLPKLNGIQQGKKYTLSFDIKISNDAVFDGGDAAQLIFYAESVFHNGVPVKKISEIEKGKWIRVSVTVDADGSQTKSGIMRIECNKRCTAGYFETQHFKLEEGTEASGFDQNGGGSFTEVIKDVKGLKTTVSNQQNQITEITQSASGMQATLQQNKDKINQLTASAQHLQTDIRDLTNNTNSKFSQLSSNINMKVSKGEVVSQINLSPDNVWIDGKKVKITGETYIQNGVIKDAMIASLKVDKLTGSKATFLQSSIDSITRKVEITPNGMKFTGEEKGNNWSNEYLEVDSGHLKIYSDGDYRKQYFYMGTAKRSSALNVTLGVVNNGNDYNDYPTLALRSAKQNNFIATRKSAIMSGTSVYIGNNTAYYDNNNLYNSFLNASTDGNIEMDTTSKVFIGANNGVYFRPGFNKNDSVYFCKDYQWNQEQGIEFTRTDNRGMMIRAKGVYNNSGGDSPNLFIRSSGYIYRSTSARKYKEDIKYMDNLDHAKKILEINPATWVDKAEKRAFFEGKEKTLPRRTGFIADDFDALGLDEVVVRDDEGEIEGLAYDKLTVYTLPLIKDLYTQNQKLMERIELLEEKVASLQG